MAQKQSVGRNSATLSVVGGNGAAEVSGAQMTGQDSQQSPPAKAQPQPGPAPQSGSLTPSDAAKPSAKPRPGKSARRAPKATPVVDLSSPGYFLNRELTWLEFNRRVLNEAADERTPLLERLKFIAIVGANLDEFFMKRIGGLKQQVGAGVRKLTVDGRTPEQQITECYAVVRDIKARQEQLLNTILAGLEKHGIRVLTYDRLTPQEKDRLRAYYIDNIFPLLTPQAVDPAHPFPFISNLSLNLLVSLHYPESEESRRARVKVPIGAGIPRFIEKAGEHTFVPLEEVVAHNLDLLFPGLDIETSELFTVTRNANTEQDQENADDLLATIESAVRNRKFSPIVNAVIQDDMDPFRRGMLAADLGLDEDADLFQRTGMMRMCDLHEIASLDIPDLRDPPHYPVNHARLQDMPSIFYAIRDAGSMLLQHPYESFPLTVERFVKEASRDEKVLAIKMTLYRTSSDTKILDYLIDAARNGKQVAVVVELQASFDETANIRWASRLEEAGIHVTYGVMGLKTHCKVILVVRQDYSGLRLYAHVGTGNYHAGTARLYDDIGLLTCDEVIGRDVVELFNYLTTGYTPKRNYKKLLPAPKVLKRALMQKIEREIQLQATGRPGLIQIKCNALEDPDITRCLYEASRAGVKVDLIVRDTCRLRPGIPGVSEHIRVMAVVGRFLEHSRIFYFANGGDEEYYIGSADLMLRNLEARVETVAPVEDAGPREELRQILDLHIADQRSVWDMRPDGSYVQRQPADDMQVGCQQQLAERAAQRHRSSKRLKKRKQQTIGSRNIRPSERI